VSECCVDGLQTTKKMRTRSLRRHECQDGGNSKQGIKNQPQMGRKERVKSGGKRDYQGKKLKTEGKSAEGIFYYRGQSICGGRGVVEVSWDYPNLDRRLFKAQRL